jgi:peptidoglycan hydrolase CwlO-like protein
MLIKDYQNAQKDRQTAIPEYSSLLNAALAAKDETIASYQRQLEVTEKRLEDKDATIESLRGQLADKDDHIATLKARIAELRRIIDAHNLTDAIMPYPMGSAESGKRQT